MAATIPLQPPQHVQDMARDKEKPRLDVVLDNQYLVLKGTGPDVEPTALSGNVTLFLTEATSIKEITLHFKGKTKIPVQASDAIITSGASSANIVCNHDWSFLQGDKKHSHTLKAGRHAFPFHLEISGSLPSTISTPAFGGSSVAYKLRAVATRPGFSHNLQAVAPVYILRSITHEDLEYQQTLDIENTWPDKLMYAITLPHKAWAAGDNLTAIVKLSPLAKGISVRTILSTLSETTKVYSRGVSHENTRVVAITRHEIIDRKAVEVDLHSANSSTATGSSSVLGTAASHFTHSAPSSRPSSPHPGPSSSCHHSDHHHQQQRQQEEQEEEDLGFDCNDIVTYINLTIPPSSAYPLLFSAPAPASACPLAAPYVISLPHSQPSTLYFTNTSYNTASPATTPPLSISPPHQHAPLPLSTNSHPTGSSVCSLLTVTPSHSLEPIIISHRMKWNVFIRNNDGHVSELRCSLPVRVLDGALLDESRGFTMRSRRLLLRASGLGSTLSTGGEGGEDEDHEAAGEGVIRNMEADRELPSYPAHVRDRVANMYLSEAATVRVSNPWVGRIGPAGTTNGSALSSPELSGQGESDIINDPPASDDRLSAPYTQPHSRASRSGRSTPAIQPSLQQLHVLSHLPHVPGSEESTPLDWVNSELLLSLSMNEEPRRIGGVPSSIGGHQESQQQSHRHHQTHSQHQQNRTFRWGSRVGSRAGSRAASPERNALSSATTINNDTSPSSIPEGSTTGDGSPGSTTSPILASNFSTGSGFASPFQNLFKATMKPFTALTGHYGHIHRPTHARSRSTTSLMGLQLTASTASDLSPGDNGSGRPSSLSLTGPLTGPGPTSSLTPSPRDEMNAFIPISTSSSSQSLAAIATLAPTQIPAPSSSTLSDPVSESTSAYQLPSASTSASASPSSHVDQSERQDPSSLFYRAFTVVPDYSIASRGFIGGVPPLSSMRGLPSYEEAEAQRREREAEALRDREMQIQPSQMPIPNQGQTSVTSRAQTQGRDQVMGEMKTKMKERGTMSEPDLAGRFGHAVRLESGTQAGTHSVLRGTSDGVGIMQQLHDGEDEDEDEGGDEDDAGGSDAIQMFTKKARP